MKGLAKITRRGELDRKIALKDEEAKVLKKGLSSIVRQYGFANVQEFYNTFRTSEDAYRRYQKELSKWEDTYGENAKPKEESFSEKLQCYQKQVSKQNRSYTNSYKDRGHIICLSIFNNLLFGFTSSKKKFRNLNSWWKNNRNHDIL